MSQAENAAGARRFGPPLARGLPIVALCVAAFAYAWIAIPLTLVPLADLRTWSGGAVGNDFLAFYSAARLVWDRGAADAYNLSRLFSVEAAVSGTGVRLPFTYPPLFLLYAAPLAAAPYLPSLYAWIVATTAPFALVARRLSGLAALLVALSPPVIQNAIDGQNGALTASLFAGGLLLLTRGRPVLAGIAFAFLAYKPQTFLLIPVCLLAAREYRALAAAVLAGAALLLASVAIFGVETWRAFLAIAPQQVAFVLHGDLPVARFPTVFMLVYRATGAALWANAAQAVSTLAAFALAAWCWRRTTALLPRSLAFAAALPLSTPYLLEYDLAVWALPAAILMVELWRGEGKPPDWAALPLLWWAPTSVWLLGRVGFHGSAVFPLALAAFAVWRTRQSLAEEPGARLATVPA